MGGHRAGPGRSRLDMVGVALVCVICMGCQTGSGGPFEKMLIDFGIRDRPEGYVSPSDAVFDRLDEVGKAEMKRMNLERRHGETKFQEAAGFQGKFFKEVRVYEDFQPLEVQAVTARAQGERGYMGYIAYRYRVYQSPRKSTRTEAAAAAATIATDITGKETYRYRFGAGGKWDGSEGERVRK